MPNPWDPYPYPAMGDAESSATYAGVGVALSQWEALEFGLARAFSHFVDDPDGEALRLYGNGRIFRDRVSALGEVANRYFIKLPSQSREGEFKRIIDLAVRFSDRRNEVAHGMVLDVARITYFRRKMPLIDMQANHHVLVPPWHTLRQHNSEGFPSYAFNKLQLDDLAIKFHTLERHLTRWLGEFPLPPQAQRQPSGVIYREPPRTASQEP